MMFSPRTIWFLRTLSWDGLLPLIVVLSTFFLRVAGKDLEGFQVAIVILVPFTFAFLRSHLAYGQIARTCHGQVPIHRQFAVAGAIVFLLIFELAASGLTMADDEPAEAWLAVGGLYLVYLMLICFALRPCRDPNAATIDAESWYRIEVE